MELLRSVGRAGGPAQGVAELRAAHIGSLLEAWGGVLGSQVIRGEAVMNPWGIGIWRELGLFSINGKHPLPNEMLRSNYYIGC